MLVAIDHDLGYTPTAIVIGTHGKSIGAAGRQRQQIALGSALYKPGPLSWRDDLVQALSLWVLERIEAAEHAS